MTITMKDIPGMVMSGRDNCDCDDNHDNNDDTS